MKKGKVIAIDEHELVQECINENRSYQEQFYYRFAKPVFSVCLKYSNNKDDAADFLQEGFIHVFKNLHNYRFEGSLEGWVKQVVKFKILDLIRSNSRYEKMIHSLEPSDLVSEDSFYDLSESQLSNEKIIQLVNNLPGKAGLILKLYVLDGLTHKEIADYLNISIGTSKSQLNRARALLKVELNNTNE